MLVVLVLAVDVTMLGVVVLCDCTVVVVPEFVVVCEVQPRPQLDAQHPRHHRHQRDGGVP